jgi:tRNA 2-thiocytidine biosynthesis protein TtcA
MKTQTLLAPFRKAINDYNMIKDGDKIAVGISGGKDSLTLLSLLKAYARFSPQKFDLTAISIDMGFVPDAYSEISEWCKNNGIDYVIEKTDIAQILFDIRKEKNPCSLCSKLRRGALNSIAIKNNCNKLALGHHRDDVMETFFLSLIFEGRLSTFAPKSYMSRSKISLIRPLIYIKEGDIRAYARDEKLPILKNPCPADKHTQRQYMKELLAKIQDDIPFSKDRIFSAINNPDRYNLWDDIEAKFKIDMEV